MDEYNIGAYYPTINRAARAAFLRDSLRVGEYTPRFSLTSLDGVTADSEDLLEDVDLALVFGCFSAPPALEGLPLIEKLHRAAPARTSIALVYTREIHPNEPHFSNPHGLVPHASMAEKIEQARALRDALQLTMPIYVDDLKGSTHLAFGGLPYFQVVIDRQGILVHRAEWASADQLQGVLQNLADRRERLWHSEVITSYSETLWCPTFHELPPLSAPP